MKNKVGKTDDDMRTEYDFDYSNGVRGKYYKRLLEEGFSIVILDPDVAKSFPDSAAVNKALKRLITTQHPVKRVSEYANRAYETESIKDGDMAGAINQKSAWQIIKRKYPLAKLIKSNKHGFTYVFEIESGLLGERRQINVKDNGDVTRDERLGV